jgi:multiple sugar transport system permease protein
MEAYNSSVPIKASQTSSLLQKLWKYSTVEKVWGYLLIAPFLILFVIFHIVPAGMAIWLSLVQWKPRSTTWVGLANYSQILEFDAFWMSMKNTFLYVLMVVPISMLLAFLTAYLIYSLRSEAARQFFQGAFYLPGVVSGLAVAIVWRFIFDNEIGMLNFILSKLSLDPVNWLGNVNTALPSLAGMAILGGGGAAIIIFVAALGGIPTEYYDAATIDGANAFRQLTAITLPLLLPAILYVLVVSTIGAFQVFIPVYILTSGGPANSTLTVGYFIYRQVFYYSDLGVAAAAGLLLLLVTVGFTIIQFRRFSSAVEY